MEIWCFCSFPLVPNKPECGNQRKTINYGRSKYKKALCYIKQAIGVPATGVSEKLPDLFGYL